jgi:lipid A 3-O-deacylase
MLSMRKIALLVLFTCLLLPAGLAQKIDNLAAFRDIKKANYFRIYYDNDLFAATDYNYTQGMSLELVAPCFEANPINYLFFTPKRAEFRYGLALETIAFTPQRYELTEIQYGDRPFAAATMLKSFMITTDTLKASRFSSFLNIGIIGPAALGEQIQVGIHKAIKNTLPQGWDNQIRNDIAINYSVSYEKKVLRFRDLFSLQATANVNIGTLFTNGGLGMNSTIGIINSPFTSIHKRNGFRLYFYSQALVNVIGYDATLQGGIFNKKSPYTISSEDVERFTGQLNCGIVLKTKSLYAEYSYSAISREYKTGPVAKWGGIRIGFTF